MATAIRNGLLESMPAKDILVVDPALSKDTWGESNCPVLKNAEDLFAQSTWLIWAIKPQIFKKEINSFAALSFKGEGMLSVMAGISTQAIESHFKNIPVIRTMPNTPMMEKVGMIALSGGTHVSDQQLNAMATLFEPLAKTLIVDEKQMDAVTAISGSGPAYIFYLSEAILEIGKEFNLEPEKAILLWTQTLKGAATMIETHHHPDQLRAQVTSPGGTTEAALKTFADGKLDELFKEGLRAAYHRSKELA